MRLRFTLKEAEVEATRLATAFVERSPELAAMRLERAIPDGSAPKSRATKIPVVWGVIFMPNLPPGTVVDGGEVVIVVNLETKSVTIRADLC